MISPHDIDNATFALIFGLGFICGCLFAWG